MIYDFHSHFSVIFMDNEMPRMSGIEAIRKIREFEDQRCQEKIPIVMMSAQWTQELKTEVLMAGANDHLQKPCDKIIYEQVLQKYI